MRRRAATLCILASLSTAACGTLLAAADDDDAPPNAVDAGRGSDGSADGSRGGDASSEDDALASVDAADATPLSPTELYRAAVMADGPIAYWRFGEASGATSYASETGAHPAIPADGIKSPKIGLLGLFGSPSQSLVFNGDPGVRATSDLLFGQLSNTVTLEAWMFLATNPDGNFRHLFQHSNGSTSFGIYVRGNEGIVFERIQGGGKQQKRQANPTTGVWHHVVATRDTGLHLYVDGVEATISENFSPLTPAPSGPFTLGSKDNDELSLPANTRVAEVAIYVTPLNATRIREHYRIGTMP